MHAGPAPRVPPARGSPAPPGSSAPSPQHWGRATKTLRGQGGGRGHRARTSSRWCWMKPRVWHAALKERWCTGSTPPPQRKDRDPPLVWELAKVSIGYMAKVFKENSFLLPEEVAGIYWFCAPFLEKFSNVSRWHRSYKSPTDHWDQVLQGCFRTFQHILPSTANAALHAAPLLRVLRCAYSCFSSFPTEVKKSM